MTPRFTPLRIAIVYALLGAAWILVSDRAVEWAFAGQATTLALQTAKGLLYIAVTTPLVYWLARRGWENAIHEAEATRARAHLREARAFQSALVDASPLPLLTLEPDGRVLTWNDSAEEVFGWSADEVIGEVLPIVPPEKAEEFAELRRRVVAGESFAGVELERRRKDGTSVDLRLSTAPVRGTDGEVVAIMAALEDVSPVKRREVEHERMHRAVEQAGEAIVVTDPRGTIEYVNPAFERISGYSREEALGENPRIQKSGEHDEAFYRQIWETILGGQTWHGRIVNRRKDGTRYTADLSISPVRDASGEIVNFVAVERDVSRELELENQLLQAQKMESIGSLAGGIAHDFNNMLTVILGNLELTLDATPVDDPRRAELEEVQAAALHSSELVGQLLGFARKQIISPRPLGLNGAVETRLGMLRRLIGEDMDLRWHPADELWSVRMDPAQLDQILTNLLINARDAIEGVGQVTIETANVEFDEEYCADHPGFRPGEYVMLAISDTGRGMDSETMGRIFEPFFTTKSPDQGTGLGLSTVYGIVKQNKGFINVYSEPGEGTTFRIYLSRHVAEGTPASETTPPGESRRGTETILVVEDEPSLLELVTRQIESLGYAVLPASGPDEATRIAAGHEGPIHLLLTDVVMPNMNGRDLYERLLASRPEMECLFMSGYTAEAIAHRGFLDEGLHFLQKPFTAPGLAAALSDVLDG